MLYQGSPLACTTYDGTRALSWQSWCVKRPGAANVTIMERHIPRVPIYRFSDVSKMARRDARSPPCEVIWVQCGIVSLAFFSS